MVKLNIQKTAEKLTGEKGYWAFRKLGGENTKKLKEEIEAFFKKEGWKIVWNKGGHYYSNDGNFIARKGKHHTKIHGSVMRGWRNCATLKVKTAVGGWADHHSSDSLRVLVDMAKKIPEPKLRKYTKKDMPDPLTFDGENVRVTEKGVAALSCQIGRAVVRNIVALNEKGHISEQKAMEPGELVWFHLSCSSPSGATFDIISDGEIFHPIRRYGNKGITGQTKPKSSVDLTKMTFLDHQLVKAAIENYVNEVVLKGKPEV